MPSWLRRLLGNELGQDVTEYTLIVGFIATIGIAVYASAGSSINSVWTTASGITSNASLAVAGGSGPAVSGGGGNGAGDRDRGDH